MKHSRKARAGEKIPRAAPGKSRLPTGKTASAPGLAEPRPSYPGTCRDSPARRINFQALEKFLFRPVVVTEGRDLTIPLPKFDVMPVDQALGALGGIFFVFEGEIDAIDNVPIGVDDVSVVSVHRLACPQPNTSAAPLQPAAGDHTHLPCGMFSVGRTFRPNKTGGQ
jgi:hypothetical protein